MAREINFIILLLNYLIIIKLKLFNINVQNVVSSWQNHNNNLAVASKLLDLQAVVNSNAIAFPTNGTVQ